MASIRLLSSFSILTLALAAGGCVTQPKCPAMAGCTADDATSTAVTAAIAAHPDLGPPDSVAVWTREHVVYLSGSVSSGYQRSVAESLASQTDGVTKVVDTIYVTK